MAVFMFFFSGSFCLFDCLMSLFTLLVIITTLHITKYVLFCGYILIGAVSRNKSATNYRYC